MTLTSLDFCVALTSTEPADALNTLYSSPYGDVYGVWDGDPQSFEDHEHPLTMDPITHRHIGGCSGTMDREHIQAPILIGGEDYVDWALWQSREHGWIISNPSSAIVEWELEDVARFLADNLPDIDDGSTDEQGITYEEACAISGCEWTSLEGADWYAVMAGEDVVALTVWGYDEPMWEQGEDCGSLHDYRTGACLRPATRDERKLSDEAGEGGVFQGEGGRDYYVLP